MDDSFREAEASDAELYRWQWHSVKIRQKLNIPADYKGWTSKASLHGANATDRHRDLLDTAWAASLQEFQINAKKAAHNAEHGGGDGKRGKRKLPSSFDSTKVPPVDVRQVRKGLYVHLDQAVQRKPWSQDSVGCLLQRTELYSYEADCVLPAITHCRLQGFPEWYAWDFVETNSRRRAVQRSLAGESYSYQVAAIAFYAAFLTEGAPWLHPQLWPEDESDSD